MRTSWLHWEWTNSLQGQVATVCCQRHAQFPPFSFRARETCPNNKWTKWPSGHVDLMWTLLAFSAYRSDKSSTRGKSSVKIGPMQPASLLILSNFSAQVAQPHPRVGRRPASSGRPTGCQPAGELAGELAGRPHQRAYQVQQWTAKAFWKVQHQP